MTPNQRIENWLASHKGKTRSAKRPFITLSYAQSLDGSITIHPGKALSLSGEESTRLTHQIRSLHDGILVGIGTVLADDPQLTARLHPGPSPQPIVLDSQLRIPSTAQLCQRTDKHCWILTGLEPRSDPGPHVEVLSLKSDAEGHVPLVEAMELLWSKGIRMLMVEGGGAVITAFLKAQLADALIVTMAPTLVGGYKAVDDLGTNNQRQLPRIAPFYTDKLGEDLIMWGDLQY